MTSTSPLRYPGGKARFTDFIWNTISNSGRCVKTIAEPFCGGAGVSLALLETGRVQRIALNDADPLVASFWQIVFGKVDNPRRAIDALVGAVESADLTLHEWRRQKALRPDTVLAAAWKCLYLNRTSFNGILHKSGPIGGWEQKNRTLDVRFNREKLVSRLRELYELRDQVERVENIGWRKFCANFSRRRSACLYLDPPYYHRAEQLYGYLFDAEAHRAMRDFLVRRTAPWILSYDDAPEVRALYGGRRAIQGQVIDQTYSAHPMGGASFVGRELVFSNLPLPVSEASRTQPHVGLSVVGGLDLVASELTGPVRTRTTRPVLIPV